MALTNEQIIEEVCQGYTERVEQGGGCGRGDCEAEAHLIDNLGYTPDQLDDVPGDAVESAFGCGNPLSCAGVASGDVVLDIGSGAGIDCLIAARKVGDTGKVIGLDMTPAMVERARHNAREAGVANAEFRMGDAEDMPIDDQSVDWVISNCVINLAPDKHRVFAEVCRVLKPGGRVAISDIVLGDELPDEVVASVDALVGCLAGAIRESEYLEAMRAAGLQDVVVSARRVYGAGEIEGLLDCGCGSDAEDLFQRCKDRIVDKVWSARLEARKPQ